MPIELIILISIFFYIFIYSSVVLKIYLDDFKNLNGKNKSNVKLLDFSIIVVAKNEENNISKLISTLKKLDHPQDNY